MRLSVVNLSPCSLRSSWRCLGRPGRDDEWNGGSGNEAQRAGSTGGQVVEPCGPNNDSTKSHQTQEERTEDRVCRVHPFFLIPETERFTDPQQDGGGEGWRSEGEERREGTSRWGRTRGLSWVVTYGLDWVSMGDTEWKVERSVFYCKSDRSLSSRL